MTVPRPTKYFTVKILLVGKEEVTIKNLPESKWIELRTTIFWRGFKRRVDEYTSEQVSPFRIATVHGIEQKGYDGDTMSNITNYQRPTDPPPAPAK